MPFDLAALNREQTVVFLKMETHEIEDEFPLEFRSGRGRFGFGFGPGLTAISGDLRVLARSAGEEGVQLVKVCEERLKEAEKRIEIITRNAAGKPEAVDFEPENKSSAEASPDVSLF